MAQLGANFDQLAVNLGQLGTDFSQLGPNLRNIASRVARRRHRRGVPLAVKENVVLVRKGDVSLRRNAISRIRRFSRL